MIFDTCPTNISVTPREGHLRGALDNQSKSLNAFLYLDLSCDYVSNNKAARDELDAYHTWQALPWFSTIGLDGFVARKKGTGANSYKGRQSNGDFVAQSGIEFELQPTSDNITLDCSAPVFPDARGPLLNTVNMQVGDNYNYRTMTSQRQRKTRRRLGKTSTLQGDLKLSRPEFLNFVNWYRCHLALGGGKFNPPWLANSEFGYWSALWVEPWSAKYDSGRWVVSINLALVWDETLPEHPLNNPADANNGTAVDEAVGNPQNHRAWVNYVLQHPDHPAYPRLIEIKEAQDALDLVTAFQFIADACIDNSCIG